LWGGSQYLVGSEEVEADVGVARGGVHAVAAEVLADVLRRGLGQQAVNTLPVLGEHQQTHTTNELHTHTQLYYLPKGRKTTNMEEEVTEKLRLMVNWIQKALRWVGGVGSDYKTEQSIR